MSFYQGDNNQSGIWQSLGENLNRSIVNPLKSAGEAIKSAYQDVTSYFRPINSTPPGDSNQPEFYQVQATDQSMSQVAENLGVPVSQLVQANNAKTLPPKGSYIRLTPEEQRMVSQGFPLSAVQALRDRNQSAADRGDPAAQNLRNQATTISQQLSAGQLPESVPSAVVGFLRDAQGKPLTLQDFYAEGYTMNSAGVLVRNAAPSPNNADFRNTQAYLANLNVPFLQQKRYDPKTKKYVKIGDLIRQGKLDIRTGRFNPNGRSNRRTSAPAQAPQPIERTTTEAPTTVLDIHLGSG